MTTNKDTPLVSKGLTAVAAVLAPILLAISPALPAVSGVSLGPISQILAFIAAALAGLGLPQIKFAAGKPIVPLTLVPILASLVPIFTQLAQGLTGSFSVVFEGLALVAAFLAGLASPEPVKRVDTDTKREVARELMEQ